MKRRAQSVWPLAALLIAWLTGALAARAQEGQPVRYIPRVIQIRNVESDEVKLPPAFQMALYENLIAEVRKTGRFQKIYRDGDRSALEASGLLTLRSTVRGFKEGSARMRQVTTVAGATSIKIRLQVTSSDGKMLLDRDVEGKVHFFGENLRATYNLAKSVAKILRQQF